MTERPTPANSGETAAESAIFRRLADVGIIGNVLLTAFKLFAGIFGHSAAMVSDAVHSLSDVFATFIAFIGVRLSKKAPDSGHQYGHDRLECVASLILGVILSVTGVAIGMGGVKTILAGDYGSIAIPSPIALVAAVVSIVTKEAMFWYTRYYAKKLNSPAFMADAWHHRSDAFSSVGSLIGIAGARLGAPVLEPVACVVICVCILKVAYDVIKDSLGRMTDSSCGEAFEAELRELILSQAGVVKIDGLQTRRFGSKIYIDVEIAVDGAIALTDAHGIADAVHDAVELAYPDVKHIMIHENPAVPSEELRSEI